uniref:Uncharacterized protein n=1 Tax=Eutreptiella gymnastica TaxID=73025 RepID=A0A7S1NRV6_9EUGL|mmetsp:Transcript_78596/g.138851  ORF Transcript_78596/g.138851 Transcript_78596/m.138851 type:complete len:106 (+) Transcript_78596:702-1019(+)
MLPASQNVPSPQTIPSQPWENGHQMPCCHPLGDHSRVTEAMDSHYLACSAHSLTTQEGQCPDPWPPDGTTEGATNTTTAMPWSTTAGYGQRIGKNNKEKRQEICV